MGNMGTARGSDGPLPERLISLVVDAGLGPAAMHGLDKITSALEEKGIARERVATLGAARGNVLLAIGLGSGSGAAAGLLQAAGIPSPTGPEALAIQRTEWRARPALAISGSDDRGLMYAELDVADRLSWASEPGDVLRRVRNTAEKPAVVERAVSKLVLNKSEFERYFFSEDYWSKYLDLLAKSRFNSFVLLFGYDAPAYFEPPYPFLFDVKGFPEVRVVGLTRQAQRRNLDALNRIVQMTQDRGLSFTAAFWTQICRGGRRGMEPMDQPVPGAVWGLTDDNLVAYSAAAMSGFLQLVPEVDAFQFRVHVESALSLPQQIPFWDGIYQAIKDSGRDVRIDVRVKGFADDMIEAALDSGLNVRLATKYWGEQLGLPFHPTHLTGRNQFKRRHGYADLFTYPRRYKMHYRLWNEGTTRVLLWGDPEYVRRFADSTHLWEGEGFEVHEPLAKKMQGHRDEETYDLLKPEYRWYDWEFERYWHFFQVFGRVGYNPDTPSEVWHTEFEKRFGAAAAPYVEQAFQRASQVLPRINAYNLFDLTAGRFWAEKQRWLDLPDYAVAEPSDTAQFVGIEEAAFYQARGIESPKMWPQQTSEWFAQASREVLDLADRAERQIGQHRNKEFLSTMVDLRVLAGLAQYHGQRIHAGLGWAFFQETRDLHALDDAIQHEREAIGIWETIVEVTDGVYHDNLIMGLPQELTGSWKDELVALKAGLAKLEEQRASFELLGDCLVARFDFGDGRAAEGFQAVSPTTRYDHVRGGYGWHHACLSPNPPFASEAGGKRPEQDFIHGPEPTGPESASYTHSAFGADLPSGHYELRFTMLDCSLEPRDYGPMWIVANGMDSTDRFVVPAGERVERTLETTVTDNRLNVVFNSASTAKWLVNSMEVRRVEPVIAHVPIRKTAPGRDLLIRATVSGPDAIASVRLSYGSRERGYVHVAMEPTEPHLYRATILGSAVDGNMEYTIEAVDQAGRRATFPREGSLKPIRITITDDDQPPTVLHTPVRQCTLGTPLAISAQVTDPSGVKWVRLRYRGVSQHQDYRTLRMLPTGERDEYRAEIPADHIRPEWDLMYYIEAMDEHGNGRVYPDLEIETPYVVVKVMTG